MLTTTQITRLEHLLEARVCYNNSELPKDWLAFDLPEFDSKMMAQIANIIVPYVIIAYEMKTDDDAYIWVYLHLATTDEFNNIAELVTLQKAEWLYNLEIALYEYYNMKSVLGSEVLELVD